MASMIVLKNVISPKELSRFSAMPLRDYIQIKITTEIKLNMIMISNKTVIF